MSGDQFNAFLMTFAESLGARTGRGVLVDATAFRLNPMHLNGALRDANIIPRYNAARVRRFAFHVPQGMPLIGRSPTREGPADFLTGYFAARRAALEWLSD